MRTPAARRRSRLDVLALTVVVTAWAWSGTSVFAQPVPAPAATSKIVVADDSKQLTVRGVSGQRVSRVVSLSVSGDSLAVTDLAFVATPLTPAEVGGNALPEPEVVWEPHEFHLRPGEPPVPVLVTFSLKGLTSGEYKSVLRLVSPVADGGKDTHVVSEIPLVIDVRHDWPWPLGILAAGVSMGVFFSWFRTTGKDRDIALTGRDGLLAIAMDQSRPRLLTEALTPITADVDDAISRSDWVAAHASVMLGEAIVYRWSRDKADWEFLNDYLEKFRNELGLYPAGALTVRTLDEQIHSLGGKLAAADTPDALRAQINVWRDQIELFRKTQQLLADLTRLRDRLPVEKVPDWAAKEDVLHDRLNALAPDDKAGFSSLQADLTGVIASFNSLILARELARESTSLTSSAAKGTQASPYTDVLGEALKTWKDKYLPTVNWLALGRATRLKLMGWFGYVFPVGVFVYTGLSQLYLNDSTFGSLGDYVSLFLWGFGSDAGGSKLQDLMRQTNGGAKLEDIIRQTSGRTDGGQMTNPPRTGG